MVIDTLENSNRYESLHPLFKAAFDFLKRPDIEALPLGRTEIKGDALFALTQEYNTQPAQDGKLEAHKKYIDIQYVSRGQELIGYAPLAGQPAAKAFDSRKDIGFYDGPACFNLLQKGMFAVFFPTDAHLPGRHAESPESVRKIVLKIAVSP